MKKRHYFAAITAFSLLLCGCHPISPAQLPEAGEDAESTVQTLSGGAYSTKVKAEKLDLPLPGGFTEIFPTQDGYGAFCYPETERGAHLVVFSEDFTSCTSTPLTPPAVQDDFYFTLAQYVYENGRIWAIADLEYHSGMAPYNYADVEYDYDWTTYNASRECRYLLCMYTTDGVLASAVPLSGCEEDFEEPEQIGQLFADGGSLYLMRSDGTLLAIDTATGTVEERFRGEQTKYQTEQEKRLLRDRDGQVMLYSAEHRYNRTTMQWEGICEADEYDLNTGQPGARFFYYADQTQEGLPTIEPGFGKYRLCERHADGLSGFLPDDSGERLISWAESDIPPMDIYPLDETHFIGFTWENDGYACYRLTRLLRSEVHEVTTLTVRPVGSVGNLPELVRQFNRSHDDIRVELEADTVDGVTEEYYKEFKLQLLTDEAPDVVWFNDYEDVVKLGKQGAFLDLYSFMDGDPEMDRSAFVPNVLTALEGLDGRLYGLTADFAVDTIAVKKRLCDKENWTMDDMLALYDSADKDVYQWADRTMMLRMLYGSMHFVDTADGTCHFDSPEFVQLLEFCSRFPDKLNTPVKDEDSPAQMELLNDWYAEQFRSYQRDENLLYSFEQSGDSLGTGYAYAKAIFGEDISLVGVPSPDGNGAGLALFDEIAITSRCRHPEEAWEFVKAWLEFQQQYKSGYSVFDADFEAELDAQTKMIYGGEPVEYYEDDGLKIYPLTQEERDHLEDYLRSVTTLQQSAEGAVWNIISEETEMYFAGDQSAQQAVERIQSRAEIMVSEQS